MTLRNSLESLWNKCQAIRVRLFPHNITLMLWRINQIRDIILRSVMKETLMRKCFVGTALFLFLTVSLRADVLFTSFGPGGTFTTSFGWGIGGPFEMAYPFMPSETAAFDTAALAIAYGPINIQRSVNIALMTDASDSPGMVIESFELVDVLPFAGSIAPAIVVDSVNHPLLEAQTKYWLSIANPGDSGEIDWGTAGVGPPFQRAIRQLGPGNPWLVTASDRFTAGAFDVTGTPVLSTPEPSSVLLLLSALIVVVGTARSRRFYQPPV